MSTKNAKPVLNDLIKVQRPYRDPSKGKFGISHSLEIATITSVEDFFRGAEGTKPNWVIYATCDDGFVIGPLGMKDLVYA